MRIRVLRTGVIGTIYGYVPSEAGHDVTQRSRISCVSTTMCSKLERSWV